MSAAVEVTPLRPDFGRWDELLAMIRASFAYMDGVIDPPSSVHRLTPELLRAKAEVEVGLVALSNVGDNTSRFGPPPYIPPHKGEGVANAAPSDLAKHRPSGASEAHKRRGPPPPRRNRFAISSGCGEGYRVGVVETAPALPVLESSGPTGEIVGCAFLAEQADHLYLGKLAVAPAWQGKGVGALLMRAVEEHALRSGKPVIELQTRVELTGNQRLFAKFGFAETARSAHPGFERATSVTMRKEVA